jgi:hypothetical protein
MIITQKQLQVDTYFCKNQNEFVNKSSHTFYYTATSVGVVGFMTAPTFLSGDVK